METHNTENRSSEIYSKEMEKRFPNLHDNEMPGLKDPNREELPQLLKNEKDRKEFANRQSVEKTGYLKSTAATRFAIDDNVKESQKFSNTMYSSDFPRVRTGDTGADTMINLKKGMTFDNNALSKAKTHNRAKSMAKAKMGKTAVGQKRRDLNPNNLFLRNQPSITTYAKDPTNKFMK